MGNKTDCSRCSIVKVLSDEAYIKPTFSRVVIYNPNNKSILFVRDKQSKKWELPGGKREEIDESIHQTAIREVNEETGFQLEVNEETGFQLNDFFDVDALCNMYLKVKLEFITDRTFTKKYGALFFVCDKYNDIVNRLRDVKLKNETDDVEMLLVRSLADEAILDRLSCPRGDLTMIGFMSTYGLYTDIFNEYVANKLYYIDKIA